jgi:hypothetical protein
LGATPTTSAYGQQTLTSGDLVGAVMEVSVTNNRVVRRDGKQFEDRYQTDWTIHFVSKDRIRQTFIGTNYSPRGINKSPLEGGLATLGRPKETPSRGGGHRLWIFDAGVLTFLRTYQGGGMKGTFTVTRSGSGFNCTARVSWPREAGVPTIVMQSYVDNARIEIVSATQSASSCSIGKRL